ncbi:protein canopy-1 isoform X2 [Cyprinus carpio]|uniref:Protein canopy-1 isoform X2 n=1 Tax=Cyprinus carpio TaxID=7962 RepID=A0A9Q9ZUC4_CYPCA|nr:protein canopy-1 isoform X2 [Cyprinus carpio]
MSRLSVLSAASKVAGRGSITDLHEISMSPWIKQVCLVLAAVFMLSSTTESKKDEALYCSACMAIAEEMNYSVSQTDPKKTIHVGGFRLKPDGSLMDKKVPLARSETYLNELLEEVCNSMSDYALYEDPDTKEKSYKRFAPRGNDGVNFPDFKNFKFDGPESSSALKFACESIVEELEDDIISLFSSEADHVAKTLCSEVSGHCKSSVFQHSEL